MRVFSIFCTYISERVFITIPDKPERGGKRYVRYLQDGSHSSSSGCGKTPAAWGVFGTRLLREDAGGYVLVAVVSFAAAAAITALCIRLRNRKNQKKGGTNKPARYEQEEKSQ